MHLTCRTCATHKPLKPLCSSFSSYTARNIPASFSSLHPLRLLPRSFLIHARCTCVLYMRHTSTGSRLRGASSSSPKAPSPGATCARGATASKMRVCSLPEIMGSFSERMRLGVRQMPARRVPVSRRRKSATRPLVERGAARPAPDYTCSEKQDV